MARRSYSMLRSIARRCLPVIILCATIQLREALSKPCVMGQVGSRDCSAGNCYLCTVSNLGDYSGIPTDANALQLSFSSEAGLEPSSRLQLLSQLYQIDVSVSSLGQTLTIPNGYFRDCTNLRVLTFYRTTSSPAAVRLVNGSFAGLSNLTKLTANGVGIRGLPVGVFTELRSLKILELIQNEIKIIENGTFDRQRKLNTLYLGRNAISSLVNVSFDGLESLRMIDLHQNKIRVLGSEMGFATLPNLEELNLADNEMLRIDPYAFTGLRRLKKLYLDKNRLSTVTVNVFSDLTQLVELDLSRNNLKNLSNSSFSHLKSLETLTLGANRLDTIVSGTFYGLTNLKTLDLGSNLIRTVEEKGFNGLESLTDLTLSDNRISVLIFSDFLLLPSLKMLDLRNNSLETLSLRITDNIEEVSLSHIDLSQNSWNCNCDIYWLVIWLNQRNRTDSIANSGSTTCSSPSTLRNVSVLSAYANHSCPFPFQPKQLATPSTKLYTLVTTPTPKPNTPVPTPTPKPYTPVPNPTSKLYTPVPTSTPEHTPVPTLTPKHDNLVDPAISNTEAELSRKWEIAAIVGSTMFGVTVVIISVVVCTRRRRCGLWDRQRSESIDKSLRSKQNSKYTLNEELTPRQEMTTPDGSFSENRPTSKDSENESRSSCAQDTINNERTDLGCAILCEAGSFD